MAKRISNSANHLAANSQAINGPSTNNRALVHKAAEQGFTLLELLIAMTIFAVLALAGWQVFDGLNRAKERAQYHADQLSELQYAYLQIQQDMSQIVPYQKVTAQAAAPTANLPEGAPESPAPEVRKSAPTSPPLLQLEPGQLSFVRFADPDPRYQSSPALVQVTYVIEGEQLIRRQFTQIGEAEQAVSIDSVLLTEISGAAWQAYTPEVSSRFPSDDANGGQNTSASLLPNASSTQKPVVAQLPKGVGLSFTYHDMPLSWQFALATPAAPSKALSKNDKTPETPSENAGETPEETPEESPAP